MGPLLIVNDIIDRCEGVQSTLHLFAVNFFLYITIAHPNAAELQYDFEKLASWKKKC